jgi:hypothetical protein
MSDNESIGAHQRMAMKTDGRASASHFVAGLSRIPSIDCSMLEVGGD